MMCALAFRFNRFEYTELVNTLVLNHYDHLQSVILSLQEETVCGGLMGKSAQSNWINDISAFNLQHDFKQLNNLVYTNINDDYFRLSLKKNADSRFTEVLQPFIELEIEKVVAVQHEINALLLIEDKYGKPFKFDESSLDPVDLTKFTSDQALLEDVDNLLLVDLVNKAQFLREITTPDLQKALSKANGSIYSDKFTTDAFALIHSLTAQRSNNFPNKLSYNQLSEHNIVYVVFNKFAEVLYFVKTFQAELFSESNIFSLVDMKNFFKTYKTNKGVKYVEFNIRHKKYNISYRINVFEKVMFELYKVTFDLQQLKTKLAEEYYSTENKHTQLQLQHKFNGKQIKSFGTILSLDVSDVKNRLYFGGKDCKVYVYDSAHMEEIRYFFSYGDINFVKVNDADEIMIYAGEDRYVHILNINTESIIDEIKCDTSVWECEYSSKDKILIFASNNILHIYEARKYNSIGKIEHSTAITTIAYNVKKSHILLHGKERFVYVYDNKGKNNLQKLEFKSIVAKIKSLEIAKSILIINGHSISVMSNEDYSKTNEITSGGAILDISIGETDGLIIYSNEHKEIRVVNSTNFSEIMRFFSSTNIYKLSYSSKHKQIHYITNEKYIKTFSLKFFNKIQEIHSLSTLNTFHFSKELNSILYAGEGAYIGRYNTNSWTLDSKKHLKNQVLKIVYDHTKQLIFYIGIENNLWSLDSAGPKSDPVQIPYTDTILSLDIAAAKKLLFFGAMNNTINIYDYANSNLVKSIQTEKPVHYLNYMNNSNSLAVSQQFHVRRLNVDTQSYAHDYSYENDVVLCRWQEDYDILVSGTSDKKLWFYDCSTSKELFNVTAHGLATDCIMVKGDKDHEYIAYCYSNHLCFLNKTTKAEEFVFTEDENITRLYYSKDLKAIIYTAGKKIIVSKL